MVWLLLTNIGKVGGLKKSGMAGKDKGICLLNIKNKER